VINAPFPGNVVGGHTIMRQADDGVLPAAPPQLTGVISKRLADALDVIEQPYLAADELADPDRHGIGAVAGTADVHESPHRQYRINRDLSDPAFLAGLF
jgi:hypothetical protein